MGAQGGVGSARELPQGVLLPAAGACRGAAPCAPGARPARAPRAQAHTRRAMW